MPRVKPKEWRLGKSITLRRQENQSRGCAPYTSGMWRCHPSSRIVNEVSYIGCVFTVFLNQFVSHPITVEIQMGKYPLEVNINENVKLKFVYGRIASSKR